MTTKKNILESIEDLEFQFENFMASQISHQDTYKIDDRKNSGIFLTTNTEILDEILDSTPNDETILSKFFLEPSCGAGVFIIRLLMKVSVIKRDEKEVEKFITNNIFFVDVNNEMIEQTKKNVSAFYFYLFGKPYKGGFKGYCDDFTLIKGNVSEEGREYLLARFDFILGNPPYISLYGRRDQKQNEEQRIYYLENYKQFPRWLKNGKINYVMLFIERGLSLLKEGGVLKFVIDTSFFETAYLYCRKLIVENYTIRSLSYNIQGFENVGSGQIILEIENSQPRENNILVRDEKSGNTSFVRQLDWSDPNDHYKFRISHSDINDQIIKKIYLKNDPSLKDLYPNKNLRTCVMLLDMEPQFVKEEKSKTLNSYPFYRGSKSLSSKYGELSYEHYFHFDKKLQDEINERLKTELIAKGIKNKKRLGFGEEAIYKNPKVYIRQSAKELIATYDSSRSCANNSLYVFSLRSSADKDIEFLKFLCGLLNSKVITFFAQQRRIIRYNSGKQPQIKVSDLYEIPVLLLPELRQKISKLVEKIYLNNGDSDVSREQIDHILYDYYDLNTDDQNKLNEAIKEFAQ